MVQKNGRGLLTNVRAGILMEAWMLRGLRMAKSELYFGRPQQQELNPTHKALSLQAGPWTTLTKLNQTVIATAKKGMLVLEIF